MLPSFFFFSFLFSVLALTLLPLAQVSPWAGLWLLPARRILFKRPRSRDLDAASGARRRKKKKKSFLSLKCFDMRDFTGYFWYSRNVVVITREHKHLLLYYYRCCCWILFYCNGKNKWTLVYLCCRIDLVFFSIWGPVYKIQQHLIVRKDITSSACKWLCSLHNYWYLLFANEHTQYYF